MGTKALGRSLRRHAVTARILGEWRARTLPQHPALADLRACIQYATAGSIAVDVGASVGNFALALSRCVGRSGQVLALEPNTQVFDELRRSTWGSSVVPLNLAASSMNGWATLSVPREDGGGHSEQLGSLEARERADVERVRCIRLDDLLEHERRVSIVKIDVEGHEHDVVQGALETLDRWRPALVVEIEQRHTSEDHVNKTVEAIVGLGYRCHGLRGSELVPWSEVDLRRDQLSQLTDDLTEIRPGHDVSYVNNFLFTATTERPGIARLASADVLDTFPSVLSAQASHGTTA